MSTPDQRLLEILERIEQRLAAIESASGIKPKAQPHGAPEGHTTTSSADEPETADSAEPAGQPAPNQPPSGPLPPSQTSPGQAPPSADETAPEAHTGMPLDPHAESQPEPNPNPEPKAVPPTEPCQAAGAATRPRSLAEQLTARKRALQTTAPDEGTDTEKDAGTDAGTEQTSQGSESAAQSTRAQTAPDDPNAGVTEQATPSPRVFTPSPSDAEELAPDDPARAPASLESLIAGKLFMVIGALIVVIGAGFFLKLAYDEGWHRMLSPFWRCVFSALFGVGLMSVGEVARHKIGRFAAVGFTGAGLGVLYATAFATYGVFELTGITTAFWLLVAVCGLGIVSGLRAGSVLLTVLALAGGYLAPVVMYGQDPPAWALPAYLLGLLSVGSALAVLRRDHRVLSTVAWWGSGLLGTGWFLMNAQGNVAVAFAFAAGMWIIAQATQVLLLRRPTRFEHFSLAASAGTTLWTLLAVLVTTYEVQGTTPWIPTAILAAACAGLGAWLSGGVGVLARPLKGRRERLGFGLLAHGLTLVPLVVLLAFDAWWTQALAWQLIGIAVVWTARRSGSRLLMAYAGATLALGSARLLGAILFDNDILGGVTGPGGVVLSPFAALAIVGLGAWAFLGRTFQQDGRSELQPFALAAGVASAAHGLLAVYHPEHTVAVVCWGTIAIAFAAFIVGRVRTLGLFGTWCALSYGGLALLLWMGQYVSQQWPGPGAMVLLNPGFIASGALIALAALIARRAHVALESLRPTAVTVLAVLAGVVLLASTSVEAATAADRLLSDDTARSMALSLWWAALAACAIVVGGLRRIPAARFAGIGLMIAATAKVLTYDLVGLSAPLRVASFVIVGLVLLAVAMGYLREQKKSTASYGSAGDGSADG